MYCHVLPGSRGDKKQRNASPKSAHTHTHKTETNPPSVVSPMQLVILQIFIAHELHANRGVNETNQVSSFTKLIDTAKGIDRIINEQDNFSY